jgi:hypothetical protein
VARVHTRSAAAGLGSSDVGSHNVGAGERRECGGEPGVGKMAGGPAQKKRKKDGPDPKKQCPFQINQKIQTNRI